MIEKIVKAIEKRREIAKLEATIDYTTEKLQMLIKRKENCKFWKEMPIFYRQVLNSYNKRIHDEIRQLQIYYNLLDELKKK